jgi:transposase
MNTDARRLDHKTLTEEVRKRAVASIQGGESPGSVAAAFGVNERTVYRWLAAYRSGGWGELDARKRGGRPRKLDARAMKWIYETIATKLPLQLKFPFALWTAAMVQQIIKSRFSVKLSHSSVCRLLNQLGLSAQRCRDIEIRTNDRIDAVDHALNERFGLVDGEAPRINGNATLRTTEGHINHGTLEGHGPRQGSKMTEIDVRMKSQIAFERAATCIVLYPISLKHRKTAVLAPNRHFERNLASWGIETLTQFILNLFAFQRPIKKTLAAYVSALYSQDQYPFLAQTRLRQGLLREPARWLNQHLYDPILTRQAEQAGEIPNFERRTPLERLVDPSRQVTVDEAARGNAPENY